MSSKFGEKIQITIFGQSHSEAIGVVIDGLPAGEVIDLERVQAFLERRAPGRADYATPRKEGDQAKILSGLFEGKTCGAPLCAIIENTNTRSKDYERNIPRPGHADFTAWEKYAGANDYRGGGHFSGRLTAPLCFAGAVCLQILERQGIHVGAHIASIGEVKDELFDEVELSETMLHQAAAHPFPTLSETAGEAMRQVIAQARMEQDSVGGIIEGAAIGLPVGLGEPMFDGVESRLGALLFAIPAVKGVEFGAGFGVAQMRGSENNDPYYYDKAGQVRTRTNHHGGALGGITSGMPLLTRLAFKPTPSISQPQESIIFGEKRDTELCVHGRHDPCILPRAVPVVEAALAIGVLDMLCIAGKYKKV